MNDHMPFGESVPSSIVRYRSGGLKEEEVHVATEVPVTLVVNDREMATLMCTPSCLREFAVGFLFTSGMIREAQDITFYDCDETKWRLDISVKNFTDPDLLGKRVYTAGCGKGVMYSSMMELYARYPVESTLSVKAEHIISSMQWLGTCSELHSLTGGVHSAAASIDGALPGFFIDDIGRHNAVDKVIGKLLMDQVDCSKAVLLATGRISSEILHKARRCAIPVVASRGAATHQTILLAGEMGITVIGFVRRTNFAIYSHPERVMI